MRKNPRLLFVAYGFPPINTIGCVRAYNMAKWLTRKGWEVTVVTPNESAWGREEGATNFHAKLSRQGIRCIRTDHHWRVLLPIQRDRRKNLVAWLAGGAFRRAGAFLGIEREAGWVNDAEKACAGLLPADVDVILASGRPFSSFSLARRLADRWGRPYVVDYRDLWTRNPYAKHVARQRLIERERSVLAQSAATIVVSPSLGESLREEFGMRRAAQVISNGFDPEELADIQRHDFGHFAIVYTGTFYPPKSSVEPLMAALRQVDRLNGSRPWAFHYYGYQGAYVRRAAEEFNVAHRVVDHGRVPRWQALAAVRGANLAVVISSVYESGSLEDRGVVTGKVFEAIGFGTPLLVIAPEGSDLEKILAVTGLGKRFAGNEVDRIAGFLQDAMDGGSLQALNPEAYSWPNIVERLDGVLREALGARP